jgi:hypothetical protein
MENELFDSLNSGILEERLGAFRRNVEKNLPLIERCGGLKSVLPMLNGRHIFIAGAGPSLERDIRMLKKFCFRREIAIIAADMALKALLAHGISPQFVISCETSPALFFAGADTSRMRLLAFSCMSPTNLRSWNGSISFYNWMMRGEPYDSLWDKAGRGLGFVATASIVSTQAVSIALGCSPASIVLLGNDMGFTDRYYARGCEPAFKSLMLATRLAPLVSSEAQRSMRAKGYEIRRGDALFYTNAQFLAAKMWFEKLFKESNCPVYDCSVPGCSETSVIKAGLADILSAIFPKKRS